MSKRGLSVGGTNLVNEVEDSERSFREGRNGDHFVLWYKTARGRARALSMFIGSSDKGDALVAIVLPLRELQETETHLRKEGFPLDRLMEEGRIHLFASEEFLPASSSDYHRLGMAIAGLRRRAKAKGLRLLLVGRVAPVLFERGEVDKAMKVEEVADSALGKARLLCLYDDSSREFMAEDVIRMIDDAHTQTLREEAGGSVQTMRRRRAETRAKPRPLKSR